MRRRWKLELFALFTVLGFLSTLYRYLDDLARQRTGDFPVKFVEEMTGFYGLMLGVPAVAWLVRRHRHWLIPGTLLLGALQTTWNWASRNVIFFLLDKGPYDYGIMPVRYMMELPIQIIGIGTIAAIVFLNDRWEESRQREIELAKAQLENLRLQLQPHFLFNALNSISSVMYEDPRKADGMIARLSDLLRATLKPASGNEITLAEELDILRLYVRVMEARFEDKLNVEYHIADDTADALVPTLILQPLVENAIKYGATPGTGHVKVTVDARRTGDSLELRVSDHGAGLKPAFNNGTGLKNTRERLERLYAHRHKFEMLSESGLTISIVIPHQVRA